MNYAFLIDNSRCIGCHACSTACKSENEVPLGVSRTWVKYVETGTYPDTRRHFQVTRCNHCANPPCVRICPTGAMFQRADGIVEFDKRSCIGCKACMQACPYDSIHIDPATNTASKCHFCAHRVELDLEPACVVVCPEHAILAGDIDDPDSEIAHRLRTADVTVRKPEQGTAPKLFYIDGHDVVLEPTATGKPDSFLWSDVAHADHFQPGTHVEPAPVNGDSAGGRHRNGAELRRPNPQGHPRGGPIQIGQGRLAEHMVQVAYNAQHKVPWHWPVPAYLVTKGIAAGLFVLVALAIAAGWLSPFSTGALVGGFVAVAMAAVTAVLLIVDLEKPERFLYILLRPQWRSWLTRGAFVLIGFSTVAGLWWLAALAGSMGWLDPPLAKTLTDVLAWVGLPLAVGSAVYTAFLFGQAEGRDLWQSPLLPIHLIVQATLAGAAALLVIAALTGAPPDWLSFARTTLVVALLADLGIIALGELGMPHATTVAAAAAHAITHGRFKRHFWLGALLLGHVVPLALVWLGPGAATAAGAAALAGLYLYEHAFVMAPQHVPNS